MNNRDQAIATLSNAIRGLATKPMDDGDQWAVLVLAQAQIQALNGFCGAKWYGKRVAA